MGKRKPTLVGLEYKIATAESELAYAANTLAKYTEMLPYRHQVLDEAKGKLEIAIQSVVEASASVQAAQDAIKTISDGIQDFRKRVEWQQQRLLELRPEVS